MLLAVWSGGLQRDLCFLSRVEFVRVWSCGFTGLFLRLLRFGSVLCPVRHPVLPPCDLGTDAASASGGGLRAAAAGVRPNVFCGLSAPVWAGSSPEPVTVAARWETSRKVVVCVLASRSAGDAESRGLWLRPHGLCSVSRVREFCGLSASLCGRVRSQSCEAFYAQLVFQRQSPLEPQHSILGIPSSSRGSSPVKQFGGARTRRFAAQRCRGWVRPNVRARRVATVGCLSQERVFDVRWTRCKLRHELCVDC